MRDWAGMNDERSTRGARRAAPGGVFGAALLAAWSTSAGCDEARPGWAGRAHGAPAEHAEPALVANSPAVVVVDGVALTEADLALAMASTGRGNPHQGSGPATPDRAAVLERLVEEELAARRARAEGLDADPAYQAEVARREADDRAFRRQRLARLFERDVAARATVDEATARAAFDQRADWFRTTVRVHQILVHDAAAIEAVARDLAAGKPFEEVAAAALPAAPPPGVTPWDLGDLRWNQVPPAWEPALATMAPGAVSGVLEGPRGRRWIIKLVERKLDPSITFDAVRPALVAKLQAEAAEAAVAQARRALRQAARVEPPAP